MTFFVFYFNQIKKSFKPLFSVSFNKKNTITIHINYTSKHGYFSTNYVNFLILIFSIEKYVKIHPLNIFI